MNIYELEKNSTPAPWTVDDAQPSWPMQRDILVESSWYTNEQKNNAILSAHCRNNFINAIDKLKQCRNYMCGNPEFGSCSIGLDEFIKELEEVN